MSADWQTGDLALCVIDDPHPILGNGGIVSGGVYRVASVGPERPNLMLGTGLGLFLAEFPDDQCGFSEHRFRKIKPDAHESCESEFVVLLNRSKRTAKEGEPA